MLKQLGWMKVINRIAILLVSTTFVSPVAAQRQIQSRIEYNGSMDMPNGIALYVASLYFDTPAIGAIGLVAGVSEETASSIVQYLVPLTERAERELLQSQKELVCNRNDFTDAKMLRAMNGLDDLRIAVYAKYYAIVKAELSPEELSALQQWLDSLKLSTSYVVIDREKAFAKSPDEARDRLRRYCEPTEKLAP